VSDVITRELDVGDKVRVNFHPPGSMQSYFEGVVTRIDVPTSDGRVFVVRVTHEVILDREHRIMPGFHDFVRYECPNDFPGRIEVLSAEAQELERQPTPDLMSVKPSTEAEQEADEPHSVELEAQSKPEIERTPEAEANVEPVQVDVEPQPASTPRGLIGALFGRKR
jgi:hypothetical protein